MFRTMMKAKLHRARVTEANLAYVGSITIDEDLMDAVDLIDNEKVQIVNNNNGKRFETYVIKGPREKRDICLNGAAARLVQPDDVIIILSYALMPDDAAQNHRPKVAIMDENNNIAEMLDTEPASTVL
ncbi:aspartate 1-decarboxylase [Salicibibacter cibi]|uniref:Aspartate 1-decarboxylase n=1 Tax=Salicibibacter cibi TaxID=2743001 RepID=A0A7T6ZCU6_9BACI|nr:aspartate 1-decarboxylase [Salicibibacter cibi]QQK81148.1 aspartate 1-decarboxylase [Salicibibacter cibi]